MGLVRLELTRLAAQPSKSCVAAITPQALMNDLGHYRHISKIRLELTLVILGSAINNY